MGHKKSIVFLGYSQFPIGLAEVQKIILISKSLLAEGNQVTVICKNGIHAKISHPELDVQGFYQGIEYVYVSGSCFRNENFFLRRINEIKGAINQIVYLKKRKKNKQLDFAVLSTNNFSAILFYYLLSRLFKFKTILNYVEYYSSMNRKWFQLGKRLNDKLFDTYAASISSAVFPISEFLIDHIKKVAPQKKYLKIPGLTDFGKYNGIEYIEEKQYFLFCGDVRYKEIILFIIDSFGLLPINDSVYLYLVIGGNENSIFEIKQYISQQLQKDKIIVYSKIPEHQLYTFYKNAKALLIPLRPTFQDIARFPHKTGEYLASGNPVISTNYGEVKYYFNDMESMLLADSYDIHLFAEKMQFVIANPNDAKKIGRKGKNIASTLFDYRNRAGVIDKFLDSVI